jgi:hypothetical protein
MLDASPSPWMPLGSLLVHAGVITAEQLELALIDQQQNPGRRLGRVLVECGWASSTEIALALSEQYGIAFLDVRGSLFDTNAAECIDRALAERCQAVPVRFLPDGVLLIAVADPTDVGGVEEMHEAAGMPIRIAVADSDSLAEAFARVYGG